METAKQAQVRQGLNQYIGAVMTNPDFTPKENKHLAVAMLCEEALKLIISDNNSENSFYIDDYACVPLLRGFQFLMLRNVNRIKQETPDDFKDAVQNYISLCNDFNRDVLTKWIDSNSKGADNDVGTS